MTSLTAQGRAKRKEREILRLKWGPQNEAPSGCGPPPNEFLTAIITNSEIELSLCSPIIKRFLSATKTVFPHWTRPPCMDGLAQISRGSDRISNFSLVIQGDPSREIPYVSDCMGNYLLSSAIVSNEASGVVGGV